MSIYAQRMWKTFVHDRRIRRLLDISSIDGNLLLHSLRKSIAQTLGSAIWRYTSQQRDKASQILKLHLETKHGRFQILILSISIYTDKYSYGDTGQHITVFIYIFIVYIFVINWTVNHDDVIKSKHFPRRRPFVRGIHRSSVNSAHKGQWRRAYVFYMPLNKRLSKQWWAWWLRRHRAHYDVIEMILSWMNVWSALLRQWSGILPCYINY